MTEFLAQLKRQIGLSSSTNNDPTEIAFRNFQQTSLNPFVSARGRIKRLLAILSEHALKGNHTAFDSGLRELLTELTIYNSNISRFVVTPSKDIFLKKSRPNDWRRLDVIYREHNKLFVHIRAKLKNLSEMAPLAIGHGDGDVAEATRAVAIKSLKKINIDKLEMLWRRLLLYEEMIYDG